MNGKEWVLRRQKDIRSGTEHINYSRPERQVQTAKHPLKRAAGTTEGETTIRNMLRDTFLPDIVFL